MKLSIYEQEGRYVILPSNGFIYFWWAIYQNLKTLFAPFPHNLTQYYKTVGEAKKELQFKSLQGK